MNKKNQAEQPPILAPPPPVTESSYHGKISLDDARKIYEQAMEEQILSEYYSWPSKPSSDGSYHIQVTDPTKSSGRRQIKARTLSELKVKVLDHERGINGQKRKTFKECFEISQNEKLKYVKNPEKLASVKNSLSVTNSSYRRFFAGSSFENKYVDEISKKDIEAFCLSTLKRLDLRKKAFDSLKGIIRTVMRLAYEEYWISEDPYQRVNFKKYNDLLIPQTPVSKRVHSDKEIADMLDFIHAHQQKNPAYLPSYALELVILMGLRRGEVAPLEWSDVCGDAYINISKEQITLKSTDGRHQEGFLIVNHTKTHIDRQFPQTSEIREFLARLKVIHNTFYPDSPYLFPAPDNENGVINNRVVYKFYSRMCRKCGIPISRETIRGPHSFRRNGITKVTNNTGGDLVLASQIYGNSPATAKKNYYTGLNLEKARAALEG